MKGHKVFWIGVGFAVVGIVLMSIPERECVDCLEEVTDAATDAISKVTDAVVEVVESPSDD